VARRLHAACDAVVVLGPRMREKAIEFGAPASRTAVVHNWADEEQIVPVPRAENRFLREQGLEGRFVALYSGNLGRAHSHEVFLEAARRLAHDPEFVFLFVGGGKLLPVLREAAEREGLPNVRFLDYLPRAELRYSLSAASVALVSEQPAVAGLLVPSKTYGILASGVPLLFLGSRSSDVAAIVEETGCGLVVEDGDAEGFVRALTTLRDDPALARELGGRGRAAAVERYSLRRALERWNRVLESCLETAPDGARSVA
jgi:glycosyltransferase involved in cell wall biosynthesis